MTTFADFTRSDFNADQLADILWRDQAGDDVLWLMNNNTAGTIVPLPHVTPDWHFKAAAEFDKSSNGDADILWQNDNGALALWQMSNIGVNAIAALPNPGPSWHVVGDNDFDGDNTDDIFFQNDNGALAMWTGITTMGTVFGMFASTQDPGPTWHVVGTGATDGLSHAGILWQNNNGALAVWTKPTFGPGTFTFNAVAALPTVDASWHVKGLADFNGQGNGTADVVFQNDNGAVAIWEMGGAAGTTINAMNLININPGPAWHIVGLRDMDGDVKKDIVFQNDNGAAAVWEDYRSLGGGSATFDTVLAITPNPNPNGHVWDLL